MLVSKNEFAGADKICMINYEEQSSKFILKNRSCDNIKSKLKREENNNNNIIIIIIYF